MHIVRFNRATIPPDGTPAVRARSSIEIFYSSFTGIANSGA